MRALRALLLCPLAACGSLLPSGGDDEALPPRPIAEEGDASTDAVSVAEGGADASPGDSADDPADAPAGDSGVCKKTGLTCAVPTDCCFGLTCEAVTCCIPDGMPAVDADACCSGGLDFGDAAGSRCQQRS